MARATARRPSQRDASDFFGERVLVCDGAMGTMLQAAGVSLDLSLPELSVSRPELVSAIHGAYIAAGAEIIETNTFGACRTRLGRHGLEARVAEINLAAVRVASRSGGQIRVVGLSPNVQATFELARLHRIFDIFPTEHEALAS